MAFAKGFIMAPLMDGILLRAVVIGFCESKEERKLHPLWGRHSIMQKELSTGLLKDRLPNKCMNDCHAQFFSPRSQRFFA